MFVTLTSWLFKGAGSKARVRSGSTVAKLVLTIMLGLCAATAQAYSGGIAGRSQAGCTESGCHTGLGHNYTASFSGSSFTVAPNATATFNFNLTRINGTQAGAGGLDVSVSNGTLTGGSNTRVTSIANFDDFDGEITHSVSEDLTGAQNGNGTWDFLFNAPNSVGTVTVFGCGNPADGDGGRTGDGPAACTSRTITINRTPNAANDSYSINKNSLNQTLSVLSNDTTGSSANDPGDSFTITSVGATNHGGTVTRINSNTQLRYTPANGYSGPESFTYTVTDSQGATDTATVSITVVNHAPVATSDSYPASENSTLTVPVGTGVIANDTDSDGDSLTATLISTTTHGTLSFNPNGSFTYTPVAAYSGTDSFVYRVSDSVVNSANATVTINIAHVAFAPVATGESYSTSEDTTLTVPASGVLANDTDANNDALTAVIDTTTAHGTLTLNINGSFTYVPAANYNGADSFTYHAFDGGLGSNVVTVSLTVNAVNDAPVATADSYSTNEDTTLTVSASGILVNDTDVENNPLTASLVSTTAHGSLTLNSNGSFNYVPVANYNGPDSFTYRTNDGSLNSNTVTVSITVVAVNDAPVAVAESYSTNEDTSLNVSGTGVLDNDTDTDGNALTAAIVTTTSHGTVTLNANGSFGYVPVANYNGPDSFTYRANDGQANSNTVTVNITVTAVNDAPVAVVDTFATDEDITLTVDAGSGVMINDTDVDGDVLTASLMSSTSHGTLTFNSNGSFTYVPNPHFRSADSFSYRVSDGQANSSIVIVTINVRPVNHAPVANNDGLYSVTGNATRNVDAMTGVLANDTDPDVGDVLSAALVAPPANGTLTLSSDGSFSYMPNPNYFGTDQFTYRATDGSLTSDITVVSLVVVSPPPVITTPADIKINATGYLTPVTLGATATDSKDGTVAVTADTKSPLRPGHHVVTYTAQNAAGTSAVATQNVDIVPLATLGPDQISSRGRTLDVEFFLNGSAVTYPVTLTYNVSGSATTADANVANGDITINSGTRATLQVPISAGTGTLPDRTLMFTLVSATNAALGSSVSTTITIVDHNVSPAVSLVATQQSQPRARLYSSDDMATVVASVTDPDVGDVMTYDWTGTDPALPAPATSQPNFTLCPVVACTGGAPIVPTGSYPIVVKVTDSHGASNTAHMTLFVSATKPALTLSDSDQDKVNDLSEGLIDSWNTGLPDFLNPFDESYVVPDRVANGATTHALETQPGLSLHVGAMSLANGGTGALVVTPPADGTYVHTSGVFDFEIRGVQQTAGVASIVLPLQSALDAGAVYRQYVNAGSGWRAFTASGADAIYSAPATNGACPGPDSSSWTTGLSAKAQCVRLTLTDGGPNDADGVVNGAIVNLGGAATTPSSSSQSSSQASSGATKGGGTMNWNLLWMLGALLIAMSALRQRKLVTRLLGR